MSTCAKKKVKDSLPSSISDCFTLGDIRAEVDKMIAQYGESATIEFDSGYSSLDERVYFEREETDKEYQKRLKDEVREKDNKETLKMAREAKEYKEYLRLQAKYDRGN